MGVPPGALTPSVVLIPYTATRIGADCPHHLKGNEAASMNTCIYGLMQVGSLRLVANYDTLVNDRTGQ